MTKTTDLVVQWLRLHAPNTGGLGLIFGQGTGSHMLQGSCMLQLKISHAAMKIKISNAVTKTQNSQINK